MSGRLTKADRTRYRRLVAGKLTRQYGRGPTSIWAFLSDEMRQQLYLAEAANLVLSQDASVAERLSLADAQELILACVEDIQ